MRAILVAILLAVPLLAGCGDKDDKPLVTPVELPYAPGDIRVTGYTKSVEAIEGADGVALSALVYTPQSDSQLPGGLGPRFPVVVFLHGWGGAKESYEGTYPLPSQVAQGVPADTEGPMVNRLARFAQAGFIAVAYDARGFGASGGQSTLAGPLEIEDLHAVIEHIAATRATNGHVGLVGQSYGAGQALLALRDPLVDTVATQYGWTDLSEGVIPGNVPKLEWMNFLYLYGQVGSQTKLHPQLTQWYLDATTRMNMDTLQRQTASRDSAPLLPSNQKPIFACQGMQESLFPQIDRLWETSAGFVRAYTYTGGHGSDDEGCWERTEAWMQFFIGGFPTGVDGWPALVATDAITGTQVDFPNFPQASWKTSYLRGVDLAAEPSQDTFTVSQRILANPVEEPSGIWDQTGLPFNPIPEQLRTDPSAVFFATAPSSESHVLLGEPVVTLVTKGNQTLPFQVVASLSIRGPGGDAIISHGAVAALQDSDVKDGQIQIRMGWTKADIKPGDQIVLKIGGNDPDYYLPLPAYYETTFTAQSSLALPFFEG